MRELADVQAFDVLVELLAGSQHARLLKTLQQDLGIVTGGNAGYAKTRYPGVFEISAFFPAENRRLVEQAILTEIQRLVDGDLEENEVVRARTSLLAKLARRLETNAALAGELGFSAVTAGDYRLALTAPAGIRAVSAGDVISVAQKYLDPNGYLEVVLASQGAPQAPVTATTLLTETLSNGIRLILQEDPTVDVQIHVLQQRPQLRHPLGEVLAVDAQMASVQQDAELRDQRPRGPSAGRRRS